MKASVIKNGSITSVPGFMAGSSHCGLKNSGENPDICIIYIPDSAECSGVFTKNMFKAAPVILDSEVLSRKKRVRGIVVNSGIANACTGKEGMENAKSMQSLTAASLAAGNNEILVASTGVIGKQLPMEKVEKGIRDCADAMSLDGGNGAARAIMTTDLVEKKIAIKLDTYNGGKITIGGIAKGSGMIEPDMATMLAFLGTDADVERKLLDEILKQANAVSFNSITVDGCQSTNDTALFMANGKSRIKIKKNSPEYNDFLDGVIFIMKDLAKKMVMDGEGATKFIEIKVSGAADNTQAKKAAMKIANSNLFKAAMFGQDLNWGRINAALGSSGCDLEPDKVDIHINDVLVVKNGTGLDSEKGKAKGFLKDKHISLNVDLKNKGGSWTVWTSDLSFDYIKINALYHN